jgi:hypothetical protein
VYNRIVFFIVVREVVGSEVDTLFGVDNRTNFMAGSGAWERGPDKGLVCRVWGVNARAVCTSVGILEYLNGTGLRVCAKAGEDGRADRALRDWRPWHDRRAGMEVFLGTVTSRSRHAFFLRFPRELRYRDRWPGNHDASILYIQHDGRLGIL